MNYQVYKTSSINNLIELEPTKNIVSNCEVPTLNFDRLMLKMPLYVLQDWNKILFISQVTSTGSKLFHTFDSKTTWNIPYQLWIKIDVSNDSLLINFSSKALLDRYLEQINVNTIFSIIEAINNTGVVCIDVEEALKEAEVVSCDLTIDRYREQLKPEALMLLSSSVKSKYWHGQSYRTAVSFVKKSKSGRSKGLSFTIYDKAVEMNFKQEGFFRKLNDPIALKSKLTGLIREELKINKIEFIKSYFKIADNKLSSLFNARINPVDSVKNEIFGRVDIENIPDEYDIADNLVLERGKRALNEFKNELFCKYCNYDIKTIEAILRKLLSSKTNYTSSLKPYLNIINREAHMLDRI